MGEGGWKHKDIAAGRQCPYGETCTRDRREEIGIGGCDRYEGHVAEYMVWLMFSRGRLVGDRNFETNGNWLGKISAQQLH